MCYRPINLSRTEKPNFVPCGKCPKCKSRIISNWAFRLMHEERKSLQAHWVTLTYADGQAKRSRNNFLTLDVVQTQLFFKRLRQIQNRWYEKQKTPKQLRKKIKYFLVGEYGDGGRPHYHAHIFNAAPECIRAAWQHGFIFFGTVTYASCIYTMKYVMKPGKIPQHKRDDRRKEFRTMSKGLGASYITPQIKTYHRAQLENRAYCVIDGNRRIGMPRYYLQKIYSSAERESIRGWQERHRDTKFRDAVQQGGDAFIRDYLEGIRVAYSKMYADVKSRDKIVDTWLMRLSPDLKRLLIPNLAEDKCSVNPQ